MTLKESLQIASQNPNTPFASELRKRIESGQYNNVAKQEGIDISSFVKTKSPSEVQATEDSQGIKGVAKGFVQEGLQRVASVGQNVGKVVSGFVEKVIGTKPDESATQLANVTFALQKKLKEIPEGDPRRQMLEDTINRNQETFKLINEETKERQQLESAVSERPEFLTPQTEAEKAGANIEKIGEFFIPAGYGLKALEATKAGQALSKADDLNFAGKAVRSLIKGIGEGTEFAVKTGAQAATEDLDTQAKTAASSFLLGLALTPVFDVAGNVLKAGVNQLKNKLPERLYSTIFKTTEEDLKAEWNSVAKGKPFNKTLAKEAIDENLFGSSEKMGVYSIKKLGDVEKMVQADTKASKSLIDIGKDQFKKSVEFLKDIANQYDGPFSSVGPLAENLAKELQATKGKIDPNLTLRLKRFFDALRNNSSFKQNPTLSLKQDGLKNASNIFRQKLYEAGFKDAMEQERMFIQFLDSLLEYESKSKNKNVIGLVDLLAGGGGLVSGGPLAGLSAGAAIRAFQKPTFMTGIAKGLEKTGNILEAGVEKAGQTTKALTQVGTRKVLESVAND